MDVLHIKYVPTMDNIADIFMKTLPATQFRMLREKMVSDLQVFIMNGAVATAKFLLIPKGFDDLA